MAGCRTAIVGVMLLGGVALSACGSDRRPEAPPAPVSPNGEPLGGPGANCPDALTRWFDTADVNHDGSLDQAEFMADATRWFAAMDSNHDGFVTPDELTTLRLKLAPPKPPPARGSRDEEAEGDRRERRGWFAGRGPRPTSDRPDPVMSADVNLDNRVSAEEFQAQALRVFGGLDRNRDGRLSKDEVLVGCRPPTS